MSNESPAFIELPTSGTKNKYTKAERKFHCRELQKSGLSMSEYGRRNGIAVSSISTWMSEAKLSPSLLQENKDSVQASQASQPVEIILTSGIRLRFSRSSVSELLRLIKALELCS